MLRTENAASRRASVQVPACKSTSVGAVGHERYETMEQSVTLGDKETQALEFTYGS